MVWIPILGIIGSFVTAVLIVSTTARARMRRAELQAEVQSKLIDRFGTAPELIDFLQSPAGKDFISGVQSAPRNVARDRVAGGFSRAIVLTMLGAAFAVLTVTQDHDFIIPAVLLFFLGAGYLLATYVSWKLTRAQAASTQIATPDYTRS
ncbi:MAG TPA: hypothetical protein VF824_19715 [Thermoanaerobaculia bacterium]|jgi:hypothetical protein